MTFSSTVDRKVTQPFALVVAMEAHAIKNMCPFDFDIAYDMVGID